VYRWDAPQFRIDLRNKRAELQLLCKLASIEIPNRACLNFARIDLRVFNRLFAGLDDDVPDGFAFLLQVALKIRPPAAEDVNFIHYVLVT
jgi:hypothetical protein